MKRVVGIIPARYASSRLPGKPLEMIGDSSLIMRVYDQVKQAEIFMEVLVATDDSRILEHVISCGGQAVMTSSHHDTGTSRCLEAVSQLKEDFDFVVNIQGDEPFIQQEQLHSLVEALNPAREVVTMYKKIEDRELLLDPNTPKIVMGEDHRALYFSRAAVPYLRGVAAEDWLKQKKYYQHIGIYAYRKDILATIVNLPPSSIETMEQLEQLRWLANGIKIHLVKTDLESISVDTFEDLEKARNYIA